MDLGLSNMEMPMGLNMALAQNLVALEYFASLSSEKQQSIIDETHTIHSKAEMRTFVEELSKQGR